MDPKGLLTLCEKCSAWSGDKFVDPGSVPTLSSVVQNKQASACFRPRSHRLFLVLRVAKRLRGACSGL